MKKISSTSFYHFQHFRLINTSQTPVALAGGIFNDVKTFNKDENLLKQHTGLLNICFYGENVSCHSDVLDVLVFDRKRESKREAEKFMNKVQFSALEHIFYALINYPKSFHFR